MTRWGVSGVSTSVMISWVLMRGPQDTCSSMITRITLSNGDALMKILFSLRNRVAAGKSLKASAWYLWY
ncbi:tryptorubin family RiPP precursor [Streptomyces sp. NPDC002740]